MAVEEVVSIMLAVLLIIIITIIYKFAPSDKRCFTDVCVLAYLKLRSSPYQPYPYVSVTYQDIT